MRAEVSFATAADWQALDIGLVAGVVGKVVQSAAYKQLGPARGFVGLIF